MNGLLTQHARSRIECDTCDRTIIGARFVCLECLKDDGSDQIDLCSRCVNTTPRRQDFVHQRGHFIAKFTRYVHDRLCVDLFERAKKTADTLRKKFPLVAVHADFEGDDVSDAASDDDAESECSSCGNPILPPCWLCVECGPLIPSKYHRRDKCSPSVSRRVHLRRV